jgi:quercetin dioxygenase-like cupin family protein
LPALPETSILQLLVYSKPKTMKYFIEPDQLQHKEMLKGITAAFLQTENLTMGFSNMKAGSEVPLHQHIEEAIDIVLEGQLEMQIGDTKAVLQPGVISCVPSNIPHRAIALTDCKVVTVFYPKRNLGK